MPERPGKRSVVMSLANKDLEAQERQEPRLGFAPKRGELADYLAHVDIAERARARKQRRPRELDEVGVERRRVLGALLSPAAAFRRATAPLRPHGDRRPVGEGQGRRHGRPAECHS